MFKFKIIDSKNDTFSVSYNGVLGKDSRAYLWNFDNDKHRVYIYDDTLRRELLNVELKGIFEQCSYIEVDSYIESSLSGHRSIDLEIKIDKNNGLIDAIYEINLDFEEWNEHFSILALSSELSSISESTLNYSLEYYRSDEDFVSNGFGFKVKNVNPSSSISDFIEETSQVVTSLILKAKKNLKNKGDKVLIELSLESEIRTPCEQYLMYFTQFLQDLGVQATSEITHNEGVTLFSVTPENKEHALSVIANCLAAYLSLPSEFEKHRGSIVQQDVALMQLEANIMHLKSQLMLANSIIEAKDTSIQNLKLSHEQYLIGAPSDSDSKKENLIGEVVKVKEYEGKLISIDTPRLLRNLKRIIGRK
ncbi:hypothetical protein [Vibrio splendidus]|uniref:hypothetical protein n=1 Tax=Vibrio splendidus TaxID=29497 RepID=UPI000CA7EAA4|nr:hypothetical protein [Vibrio splendidus]PMH20342.1 hypothetical protein BCU77_20445 [Vibrio splendidus]